LKIYGNMIIIRNVLLAFLAFVGITMPVSAYGQGSASVLCYHAFLDKKKDPYCFTLDELHSHIVQLRKEGFRFITIDDILRGKTTGSKNILITVDDGNRSVFEAYQKVFKPNGIRPLLGIYPNIIGKKQYALTWEQLKELADAGCDVAAHGYFHLKVNQRLYDRNASYFNKEIYDSKKKLEQKLNRRVSIFVYPFGLFSDITIKTLKIAGYECAFTIDNGKIDIPIYGSDVVYKLPRYMVTKNSWKYCFNSVIRNARARGPVKLARYDGVDDGSRAVLQKVQYRPDLPTEPLRVETGVKPIVNKISPISFEPPHGDIRSGDGDQAVKTANMAVPTKAKAGMEVKGSYADIKKSYKRLTRESYNTYAGFLRVVRGKVERIRHQVKQYVVSHF
jgi:peptidoglycan/xylan/chitin deacetylase (PgdA/CDA1 family)